MKESAGASAPFGLNFLECAQDVAQIAFPQFGLPRGFTRSRLDEGDALPRYAHIT